MHERLQRHAGRRAGDPVTEALYPPEFTIAFVVHADLPLLERTVPTTIETLTAKSTRTFDLVLVVDGAETAPVSDLMDLAERHGFDEIRLRRRSRHVATGNPSNNGHAHLLPAKGRFLISVEGDVAAFRTGTGDVLDALARAFDDCPELAIATKIDDHQCWLWQLEDVGPPPAHGIRSVNRVASHFLVYGFPGPQGSSGRRADHQLAVSTTTVNGGSTTRTGYPSCSPRPMALVLGT